MQTTTLVTSNPKNFVIVGSIYETMLSRVPNYNPIIVEYKKIAITTKGDGSEWLQEDVPKKK